MLNMMYFSHENQRPATEGYKAANVYCTNKARKAMMEPPPLCALKSHQRVPRKKRPLSLGLAEKNKESCGIL
jgi:hypothetical protein